MEKKRWNFCVELLIEFEVTLPVLLNDKKVELLSIVNKEYGSSILGI